MLEAIFVVPFYLSIGGFIAYIIIAGVIAIAEKLGVL